MNTFKKTYYTSNSFLTKKLNKRFSRKMIMVDVCLFLGVAAHARTSKDMAGKHPGPTSMDLSRTNVQPGRINIKEGTCKKKEREFKVSVYMSKMKIRKLKST